MPTFIEVFDQRLNQKRLINVAYITSVADAESVWGDGRKANCTIEFIGDAGHHTAKVFPVETYAQVVDFLTIDQAIAVRK
jgi:hypothetical protein